MRIATIGRGKIGTALGRRWSRAGHTVTALGRDGGDASGADAILVAVPPGSIAAALARVSGLAGQVAIDATNPADGRAPNYESLTHEVKALVGGPAAKAFNLQHHLLYERLDDVRARPSNLFAADDQARAVAEQLIRDAGFDPVFVGGLEKARALEECLDLFRAVRIHGGGPHFHRFARPGEL